MKTPLRKEIWLATFDPVEGHEQGGMRPAVILSVNEFNALKSGMVVVVPCTTRDRGNPMHVRILPPEGGLSEISFALPDMIRSIAQKRLIKKYGVISEFTMNEIETKSKLLLGFG